MSYELDTPLMKEMRRHRSIRRYKPDLLPAGMLEAIVSTAQMASTSSYMQQYLSLIHI